MGANDDNFDIGEKIIFHANNLMGLVESSRKYPEIFRCVQKKSRFFGHSDETITKIENIIYDAYTKIAAENVEKGKPVAENLDEELMERIKAAITEICDSQHSIVTVGGRK